MADSARIQYSECCNGTGSNADTEKRGIIDGMSKSTIFSSMDLMDGFYQILMRERDTPYNSKHSQRDTLGMASNTTEAKQRPWNIQQICNEPVETGARIRTEFF